MRRREPASLAAGPAVDENRDMRLHSRFATGFAGLVLSLRRRFPDASAQPRSHRQSNRAHRSHPQTHRRGGIRAITAASYDAAVLASSPAAFWDMSRTSASEADLTGHGHTGTYAGRDTEGGDPRRMVALPPTSTAQGNA